MWYLSLLAGISEEMMSEEKKTKPPTKPNNKRVKKFKGKQRDHPLLEEGS